MCYFNNFHFQLYINIYIIFHILNFKFKLKAYESNEKQLPINIIPNNSLQKNQQLSNNGQSKNESQQNVPTLQANLEIFKCIKQRQMQMETDLNHLQNRIIDVNSSQIFNLSNSHTGSSNLIRQQKPQIIQTSPIQKKKQHDHPQSVTYYPDLTSDLEMQKILKNEKINFIQQHVLNNKMSTQHSQQQNCMNVLHNSVSSKYSNLISQNQPISAPLSTQNRLATNQSNLNSMTSFQNEYSSLPDQINQIDYATSTSSSLTHTQDLETGNYFLNLSNKPTYASIVAAANNQVTLVPSLASLKENMVTNNVINYNNNNNNNNNTNTNTNNNNNNSSIFQYKHLLSCGPRKYFKLIFNAI